MHRLPGGDSRSVAAAQVAKKFGLSKLSIKGRTGALDFTGFHSVVIAPFATPRQTEHRIGSREVMSALQCLRDAFDRMDHVLSKRPAVALVTICDSHSWRL